MVAGNHVSRTSKLPYTTCGYTSCVYFSNWNSQGTVAFPLAGFGDCNAILGDIGGSGGAGSFGISALRSFPLRSISIFSV
jgi:hypothetical protein